MTTAIQPAALDIHQALQDAITELNLSAQKLIATASRCYKHAPLTGVVVGLSDEALEELSKYKRADWARAARYGMPLMVPRFTDPAVIRSVLAAGFSTPAMMAEITKTMPLATLEKKRRVA